jgi:threonine/homoserine/homoserine lactone efflux protein
VFGMILTAFSIGIAVAVPPGPVIIGGSQRAITGGFRHALSFFAGSMLSDTFYALLVYFGVSALLSESMAFRVGLWILGGAWLLKMGWDAIQTHVDMEALTARAAQSTHWSNFRAGLFITLFNPLTVLSWIALAGNFFALWHTDWPPIASAGLIALIIMLTGILSWALFLSSVLSAIRTRIPPGALKIISIGSGVVLILYGLSAWWSAVTLLLHPPA